MDVQLISLARLRAAPWNANRVSGATLAKIRDSNRGEQESDSEPRRNMVPTD